MGPSLTMGRWAYVSITSHKYQNFNLTSTLIKVYRQIFVSKYSNTFSVYSKSVFLLKMITLKSKLFFKVKKWTNID